MKASTASPSSCLRILKRARSKMMSLFLTKCTSNWSITVAYFFLSSSKVRTILEYHPLRRPWRKSESLLELAVTRVEAGYLPKTLELTPPPGPLCRTGRSKQLWWFHVKIACHTVSGLGTTRSFLILFRCC